MRMDNSKESEQIHSYLNSYQNPEGLTFENSKKLLSGSTMAITDDAQASKMPSAMLSNVSKKPSRRLLITESLHEADASVSNSSKDAKY